MIKIASIVPYQIIPPEHGGQRGIFNFYEALSGYADITCFTVSENLPWQNDHIHIVPILGSTKNKFRYANPLLLSRIKKHCCREGITLIIIEHPYYGWLGYALKKLAGLSYIVHSYNIESIRFKTMNKKWWRLLYAYEKFTHRQARASFFITDEDRQYAIQKFSLEQGLCFVATYGIEEADPPVALDKINAHRSLCKTLGINPSSLLLLFNGSLDYIPNQNAVKKIIADIQPRLKTILKTEYTIVICGKASPHMTALLLAQQYNGISYVGFVPDIRAYFLGADIFLNPVTEGGGIKTKLVEALAADTPCVSFKSGAWGLPLSVTGNRLKIVEDDDYESFCRAVVTIVEEKTMTPITRSFYDHFNQQKIAEKVSAIISTILNNDNLK